MCEITPNPVGDEARRELRAYAKLLSDIRSTESVLSALRGRSMAARAYREMAHKVNLSLYFLFQIYDWLLTHQPELVKDILEPFRCPHCKANLDPPMGAET
ncbi:hypothetical protein GCM10022252_20040 [Streptosporangium oxazolinicum]|uniref:Uncharacterized protein n=1 Tax=Streptosporangium oxazolinicum TaxID=909287 RepID=A0ABP8ANX2_9ACTN